MPLKEVTDIQLDNAQEVVSPSGFVEVQDVKLDRPSLMERARQIYGQRAPEIMKLEAGGYPEQLGTENMLQAAGQAAGGIGEFAGEAIGRGIEAITPEPVQKYIGEKAREFAESDAGKYGLNLLSEGVQAYEGWREENPRAARNVEAVLNVGLFGVPVAKTAEATAKGVKKSFDAIPKKEIAPTFDDVKSAEKFAWDKAYDVADKTGVKLNTSKLAKDFDFKLKNSLGRDVSIDPDLHPQSTLALKKLNDEIVGKEVSPQDIQIARRKLNEFREKSRGEGGRSTDDTRIMNDVIFSFDEAIDDVASSGGMAKNKEVIDMFKEARRVSKVKYKAELLDDAFMRADRAGSSFDRAIKNEFRKIANSKKKMRMFTPAEQKLIDEAAKSGITEDVLKGMSIFDLTSGRLGGAIGLGAVGVTGNIVLPALGMLSRQATESLAKGRAKKAFEAVTKELNKEYK